MNLWLAGYLGIGLIFAIIAVIMAYTDKKREYKELVWLLAPVVVIIWPLTLMQMTHDYFSKETRP
jgi:cbb3-type cytochrome oxidase subunit 1